MGSIQERGIRIAIDVSKSLRSSSILMLVKS